MGLADWFSTFSSNLAVQNDESISNRYKRITSRLNTDFWNTNSENSHSLYVGSYGRNTAIGGFSDLDMIMELPSAKYTQYNSYNGNGQSALLQEVKRSIERTYSTTSIKADGQVILVPFDDGITFEIVPAFANTDSSFTFPDANGGGSWKTTNPRPEIVAIRDRNRATNGNLIQLSRMTRSWKIKWDIPIGGLLIDALAYQFIENWAHRDKSFLYYDFMSRDFFEFLKNQSKDQEYWRAPGSGQYIYAKGLFQYKATQCYNLVVQAIAHEQATPKQEYSAKAKWREIYGTRFPD